MSKNLPPRYAGILLHPSSLPSPYGIGDFGSSAFTFIDFLEKAGQSIWQVLPFGHTGYGDSPYQCFSAFAGQPLFISPEKLSEMGLVTKEDLAAFPVLPEDYVDYGPVIQAKTALFKKAFAVFKTWKGQHVLYAAFEDFVKEQSAWLTDYALFMAIKDSQNGQAFLSWPDKLKKPGRMGKRQLLTTYEEDVTYYSFLQFLFFLQWGEVKQYANARGIRIVGDIPIFVSLDSADVWAHPELFDLDDEGYPVVVAGVPPDYFSATGQLWGNPLYKWDYHSKTNFKWWVARIKHQLSLFDYIRIDHFRGFESYWAVPYGRKNAIKGKWLPCPGYELFTTIRAKLHGRLPIFAEDLGIITPKVEALRDSFNLPGMKVLQFAFMDTADNELLPHHFTSDNCICYTGTHDNDTSIGWYKTLSEEQKNRIRIYMNTDGNHIHWDMIRTALGSVAAFAIYPMQDVLGFGSDCRMNTPSVPSGNWQFRIRTVHLNESLASHLLMLTTIYGRKQDVPDRPLPRNGKSVDNEEDLA